MRYRLVPASSQRQAPLPGEIVSRLNVADRIQGQPDTPGRGKAEHKTSAQRQEQDAQQAEIETFQTAGFCVSLYDVVGHALQVVTGSMYCTRTPPERSG